MIVDAKPRDLGLPTDAYYAVEEVHDVSPVHIEPPCDTMCGVETWRGIFKL